MHNQEGFDKLVERLLRENYSPLNESPPSLTSLSEPGIEDFSVIETAAAIDETAIEAADQLAADINGSFMGTEEWARGDIKGLESGAEILTVGSKIGTAAIADSSNENENDNLVSAATPRSTFQILMEAGKRKPTEPKLNPEFRQSLPVEKSLRHTLVEEFPQAKHQHQEKSTFRNRFDNNNLMINISDGSFSQQQPKTKQIKLDNFLPAKTTSAPPGHKPNLANKCLLDTTSIITRFDAWLRMQSQPRPEFHSLKQKNEKLDASNAKLIGTIKTDQDEKEFLSVFKVPAAYVEQNYHLAIVSHRAIAKTRCIDNLIKLHWLPITREFNDELHVLGRESYSTHHWDCLLTFAESPVMIANGFKLEIIDGN
jgi:hypothetical protein